MEVVLVTGLSGAGKTRAMHAMEDIGFLDVYKRQELVKELNERFPIIDSIVTEKDKKDFSKLFGEYLRVENILQNYDEFRCV